MTTLVELEQLMFILEGCVQSLVQSLKQSSAPFEMLAIALQHQMTTQLQI
jgi:type III secretory pathway lipoprotein EscJ